MNKLTEYQQTALGVKPHQNQQSHNVKLLLKLSEFYKQVDQQNLQMGDQGQTFQQFMLMKGIQPNQSGTGRVSFTDISKIQYFFIHKQTKPLKVPQSIQKAIGEFFWSYLCIKTQLISLPLVITKNNTIKDRVQNIEYSPTLMPKQSSGKQSASRMNVLHVLDILQQYKSTSDSILVCFVDANLYEPSSQLESNNGQDIYGRACGDGVAAITLMINSKKQEQTMMETSIHEVLHTLGFDHCLAWSCLMNPCINGQFWLCPCCILKILSQNNVTLQQWLSKIIQTAVTSKFRCSKQGIKMLKRLKNIQQQQY